MYYTYIIIKFFFLLGYVGVKARDYLEVLLLRYKITHTPSGLITDITHLDELNTKTGHEIQSKTPLRPHQRAVPLTSAVMERE